MQMTTVDAIKLILEYIQGDLYLKWYFEKLFDTLHLQTPIANSVQDFAAFRKSIIDEKIKESTEKKPLKQVDRTIYL